MSVENLGSQPPKRNMRFLLGLLSILGAVLFVVFGIFIFALVIFPRLVSRESVQSIVEAGLNKALNSPPPVSESISGAPTSKINPFLAEIQNRQLSYHWQPGHVHAYEFAFRIGDEANSSFKVQGDCQYTIGKERLIENNRIGTGTVFAIAPGYLATCAHVVQLAQRIECIFNDQRYAARIVDIDTENDIAILAYEGDVEPIALSQSTNLTLAESVLVIGFPMSEVLGAGVKVSAGIVSGIEESQGGRAIAIDGAINPGNSGGPVINQQGEVVGIANATLQGERISAVGFASRVDGLRNLMQKNNIDIKTMAANGTLDAKEIMKMVAPSVGQIEVNAWSDTRFQELEYNAKYSGSMSSPSYTINGVPGQGLTGKLAVSRLGEVRDTVHAAPLPFIVATIPDLIIEPFDPISKDKWTIYRTYSLQKQEHSRLGNLLNMNFHGRLFAPQANQQQPSISGDLKCVFEVVSADENTVRIKKSRQFKLRPDDTTPPLEINGSGMWEFDLKAGVTISLEENLIISSKANAKTEEVPLTYKVARVDPAIVQERVRLAKENAEKQMRIAGAERTEPNPELIDQLVTETHSTKTNNQLNALNRLGSVAIVDAKRNAVLQSLRAIIAGKSRILHDAGWKAYQHWMDSSCAPELRRIIAKSNVHRKGAINALAQLKLEEDANLFAEYFSLLSTTSRDNLKNLGPKWELAVLQSLTDESDDFKRYDLLRLLGDIGTEVSVKRLSELKANEEMGFQMRVDSAIRDITRGDK